MGKSWSVKCRWIFQLLLYTNKKNFYPYWFFVLKHMEDWKSTIREKYDSMEFLYLNVVDNVVFRRLLLLFVNHSQVWSLFLILIVDRHSTNLPFWICFLLLIGLFTSIAGTWHDLISMVSRRSAFCYCHMFTKIESWKWVRFLNWFLLDFITVVGIELVIKNTQNSYLNRIYYLFYVH